METGVCIRLFGLPRLTVGDRAVRLPTPQALHFLAHVILQQPGTTREHLAAILWPDRDRSEGRANVRRHAHYVERAFHDAGAATPLFVRTGGVLGLSRDVWVDVLAFERFVQQRRYVDAAALYVGDLLDGWEGEVFERCRARLREAFRRSVEALIAEAERAGEAAGAARWCRRLLEADPFDEAILQRLMLALARSGERAAALSAFRVFARRLDAELDAEPTAETLMLVRALREREERRIVAPAAVPLVGRAAELLAVDESLRRSRLVTIVGPPGIGKTRLAQECLERQRETVPTTVWVDLRRASEASAVARTIGEAANIDGVLDVTELVRALEARASNARVLLVLDNCEHVIEAVREAVAALLRCEAIHIAATSRERLGIAEELPVRVEPLACPPLGVRSSVDVERYEATQLLLHAVRAHDPLFTVTAETVDDVAAICRRAGGVPLALQIAGGRIRGLGPAAVARAMHAAPVGDAIAWSERLLEPRERLVLRRCAVFVGGWTLSAAVDVCGDATCDAACIVAALETLLERSLVDVRADGASLRYELLEPIREFAQRRLDEAGEREPIEDAHLRAMLRFAETHEAAWGWMRSPEWVRVMDREYPNLEAALERSLRTSDLAAAVTLAARLRTYWYQRAPALGIAWTRCCRERLAADAEPDLLARLDLNLASLLGAMRRYADALPHAERAAAAFTEERETHDRALALREVGSARLFLGDGPGAEAALRDALRLFRATSDLARAGASLSALGCAALAADRHDDARECFLQAVRIANECGDERTASATFLNLAEVEARRGDPAAALRWTDRALPLIEAGSDALLLGYAHYNRAVYARHLARLDEARRHLALAFPLLREHASPATFALALVQLALVQLESGAVSDAARIAGYLEDVAREHRPATASDAEEWTLLDDRLRERLPAAELRLLRWEGRTMNEDAILQIAGVELPRDRFDDLSTLVR